MRRSQNALVVLLVVAFTAATLALAMATRPADSAAGERFVGTWGVREPDSSGWLTVRISRAGGGFSIYVPSAGVSTLCRLDDGKLVPTAGGQAVFSLVGGRLVVTPLHSSPGAPRSSVTLEPIPARSNTADENAPSPVTTPTSTPDPNAAYDNQVVDGIGTIQSALKAWQYEQGTYPSVDLVVPGGSFEHYLRQGGVEWPTDPWTGQAMTPGTGPGQYQYTALDGGRECILTGYGANGIVCQAAAP